MNRLCTALTFWLLLAVPLLAQTPIPARFGNEWINYQQTYFKIPTAQTGLYRVSTSELQKAGFPTGTVDPTTVQLWHRGREQAIFVNGEADKKFDPADYVEFYGRQNDGVADSILYRPASAQPHPYYSLFSDTTAYFLTWRLDAQPGKRMTTYTDTDFGTLAPEPYHWEELIRLFTDTYPGWAAGIPPKIEYGHFEAGEGYTSVVYQRDKPIDNLFSLANAVRTGPSPQLEVLLVGRDFSNHNVELAVGPTQTTRRITDTIKIYNTDNARLLRELRWTDIGPDAQVSVGTTSRGDAYTPADRYSISYLKLRYPHRTSVDGQPTKTFRFAANPGGRLRLKLTEVPANTLLLDITDPMNPVRVSGQTVAGGLNAVIRNAGTARTLYAASTALTVAGIRPVRFRQIDPKKHNYLILTHEALRKPAGGETDAVKAYASYRASAVGGGFDTLTVNVNDVFDQFNSGERSPWAIRRFTDYMLAGGKPQFLLLLGRSKSMPGVRKNPNAANIDLVPTYGFPGSDPLLTAGLNGQPTDVPGIPTGRITANTPAEAVIYLNKVKEYEALPTTGLPWRKNVLALSGGHDQNEIGLFRSLQQNYGSQIDKSALGAGLMFKNKTTDDPVENANVQPQVNAGVGLLSFFGHSGLLDTDYELGLVSNDVLGYRNKGRYPFVYFSGCAVGNFFYGAPTMSTDWLLTPDRGAIAVLAQSHLGYVNVLDNYATQFYKLLADSTMLNQPIGRLQQETIRRTMAIHTSGLDIANAQEMVLQGDPAIRIFPFAKPDYGIPTGGITIRSTTGKPLTTLDDSVRVSVLVQNTGQYRPGTLPVQVKRTTGAGEVTVYTLTWPRTVINQDSVVLILPNPHNGVGVNSFAVTVNPGNRLAEESFVNNTATAQLNITGPGALPLLPADFAIVSFTTGSPTVTLLAQPVGTLAQQFVVEVDTAATFSSGIKQSATLSGASGLLSYKPALLNADTTTYFWRVRYVGIADLVQNPWAGASFTVMRNGPTGWTQRKPAQLNQNTTDNQTVTTPLIGPAANWQSLRMTASGKNLGLDVIGVTDAGQESVLLTTAPKPQVPLDGISARTSGQIRLRLRGPQARQGLTNWLVAFGPVAEGQTLAGTSLTGIEQGQPITIPVRFANIGGVRFTDSLLVEQTIYAPALTQPQTRSFRIPAPAPGDTARFSVPVNTIAMPGQNHLLLTVNPRRQPEQTFVNNTVDVPFSVRPDQFGPVLDVLVDGSRIQDSDPVSGAPVLDVLITDENQYLIRRDTVGLDLYLQRGTNAPFVRQRWQTTGFSTQAAPGPNAFRIRYPLPTLPEGAYRIRVTGRDVSGNPAAPYQIGFRVNTEQKVVSAWVAPNPFRDLTRFQLLLTGNKAPDQISLTINDLSGRKVRTVVLPARIGLNEFLWDGTAESGAALPAGVYVYKFTVSADGTDWPLAETVKLHGRAVLAR